MDTTAALVENEKLRNRIRELEVRLDKAEMGYMHLGLPGVESPEFETCVVRHQRDYDEMLQKINAFNGPRCTDEDCADYDGAHPFHQNMLEQAHLKEQALLRPEIERLRKVLQEDETLFEKLDEVMAPPERVKRDTEVVGGFVSGLNLIYTAKDIVNRAIEHIKEGEEKQRTLELIDKAYHRGRRLWQERGGNPEVWPDHAELTVFLVEQLQAFKEALVWCSGAADFGEKGRGRVGWLKVCEPLLTRKKR